MIEPSDFGLFLKEKRKAAHLTQGDLAAVINKSGQYISNIEKGKNNAPPDPSDIEALIQKLGLSDKEASLFKEKASADRGRLMGLAVSSKTMFSPQMKVYIHSCLQQRALIGLQAMCIR